MKRKLLILSAFLFLFCLSLDVSATITIQSVAGASYVETDASGNMTVYGGIAGTCANPDGSGTCDSCASTTIPAQACNTKSVYSSLLLTITFTSDKVLSNALVKIKTDATSGVGESTEIPFTVNAAANAATPVTLTWGFLCENDSNFNASCAPATVQPEVNFLNAARKIYLYVDENADGDTDDDNEKKSINVKLQVLDATSDLINKQDFCLVSDSSKIGMCGYELAVGDSKFYLKQIFTSSSVENATPEKYSSLSPDWYGVALFPVDVANVELISNNSVAPQIRKFDSQFGLPDNTVTGLENYKNYCLLMGNVSKAQNIYKYNSINASPVNTCAQPSEVIGMLTDKSCFISTAAYGSDMSDQVQLLRQFRNEFLLTTSFGKSIVKLYYQFSPPIAHFIENSEIYKAITRGLLYPFVAVAWLAINFGIIPLLVMLLGLSALIFRKRLLAHA